MKEFIKYFFTLMVLYPITLISIGGIIWGISRFFIVNYQYNRRNSKIFIVSFSNPFKYNKDEWTLVKKGLMYSLISLIAIFFVSLILNYLK